MSGILNTLAKFTQDMEARKKGLGPEEVHLHKLIKFMKEVKLEHLKIATEQLMEFAEKQPHTTKNVLQNLAEFLQTAYKLRLQNK